jgi:hypothetical protein
MARLLEGWRALKGHNNGRLFALRRAVVVGMAVPATARLRLAGALRSHGGELRAVLLCHHRILHFERHSVARVRDVLCRPARSAVTRQKVPSLLEHTQVAGRWDVRI